MKKMLSIALCAVCALMPAMAQDTPGIAIVKTDGETLHIANAELRSMTFEEGDAVLTSTADTRLLIPRAEIVSIAHKAAIATAYTVTYDGAQAMVVNPYALSGVSTEIDGAYVTTTNANESVEMEFALEGATTDGGFEYAGTYKCTLTLNGVSIASKRGAAVNILCGKRIAVTVNGDNVLADCSAGSQKACLYFKGHAEVEGDGTLTLTGNTKHALASKEYLQLKKKFAEGKINILGAVGDGIHAGQYFQMNSGNVVVRNVGDDGIQAETTDDATDEKNGQMIIKGGTLDIQCDANGVVESSASYAPPGGGGGGGWPGGGGGGGWPGGGGSSEETSCVACLKCDSLCTITGGTLTLKATGKGGKGIKASHDAIFGEEGGEGPIVNATTTGSVVSGSGENLNGQPKAIKVDGNLTINSGEITTKTSQNGGEGIECKAYLTINGGTVVCNTYDDGINAASKITVNGGLVWANSSGNDGMDCNGREGFEFNGGIVLASGTNQPEEGFDCDSYSFVINGGTLIGTGGATSNPTSAKQPYKTQSSQSLTSGTYLSLQKQDGTVICSYRATRTQTATILVSSAEFVSGTSYKLVRNSTAVDSPTATYLDGVFSIGGTLTGGTSTSITPTTR